MTRAFLAVGLAAALSAGAGSAGGAEVPEEVEALLKKRAYSEALDAAEGKVAGEHLADIRALARAKELVIKGAAAGKKRPVRIKMMGRSMRAMLVKADGESYTVKAMGVEQKKTWAETPPDRFYQIARRYAAETSAADHLALARACIALGLAEKADEELRQAIRLDFGLTRAANALSERISGALSGGGSAPDAGGSAPPASRGPAHARSSAVRSSGEVARTVPGRRLSAAEGATDPVTVNAGSISFTVTKGSGGFVDRLTWQGKAVSASGSSRSSFCDALKPVATPDGRGNVGEVARSQAVVTAISGGGSSATVSGAYRSAAGETRFVNKISASGDTLKVEQSVSIGFDEKRWRLAALGVSLSFALAGSKHRMITTVPGEKRTDWWKLDQNDDRQPNWLTSDSRSRWPLWRVGGLLVDSKFHYRTWKTNMLNTWPITTDEGAGCPGIVDLQDSSKGVTVTIGRMREEAPKEIMVNMAPGLIHVYFWSPHVAPLDLRSTGTANKSLAERLGIYPGAAKTHVATFRFHSGGQDPKSFRPGR